MAKKYKRNVSASTASVSENMTAQPARRSTITEFNPDYTYIIKDLKRIGILASSFLVILVALSFILPMIMR